MKSRAHLATHPIHPMLVTLPLGLWTGSLAFDLAAAALPENGEAERLRRSSNDMLLAGLVGALAAAVPGAIDYFAVIPPDSSAKKRGATHGILNLSLAALYGLNLALRARSPNRWGRWLGLPLSLAGYGGLMYSAWLGGTLVYRNQIGVDHRGPNATRLREGGALRATPGEPVAVASLSELETPGQVKLVHLNGHRLVVVRDGERVAAFQDHCPHRGGPLSDGVVAGGVVTCPWHGSQFRMESGEPVSGPAEVGITVYPVQIEGDQVLVTAPEPEPEPDVAAASGMLPSEPTRHRLEAGARVAVERLRQVASGAGERSGPPSGPG